MAPSRYFDTRAHMRSQTIKYDKMARFLHWLVLVLLAAQYVIAWTMPDIGQDTKPVGLVAWHLSLGTAVLAAMILRLFWRVNHPVPDSPDLSSLLRMVSRMTHATLYLLLFIVPVMGWINASSRGYGVTLFGKIPLPPLSPVGASVGHAMGDIHRIAAYVLIGLIGLHVLAALYHHFVLRDGTLRRILPGN